MLKKAPNRLLTRAAQDSRVRGRALGIPPVGMERAGDKVLFGGSRCVAGGSHLNGDGGVAAEATGGAAGTSEVAEGTGVRSKLGSFGNSVLDTGRTWAI